MRQYLGRVPTPVPVLLCLFFLVLPVAASIELPQQNGLNLTVINKQRPSLYDSEHPGTYFFNIGNNISNGGQNAVHISDSYLTAPGTLTITNTSTGTFYITDTGGKGYEDGAILLIALQENPVSLQFSIDLHVEGYNFSNHTPNVQPTESEVGSYNNNACTITLNASHFLRYNGDVVLQTWKPSTASTGNVNMMFFNAQDLSGPKYNLILVDLNTSIVGKNAAYQPNLTNYGNPMVTYAIHGYSNGNVSFVPYAWVFYQTGGGSFFNQTIGWTSRSTDSSWLVTLPPLPTLASFTCSPASGYPPLDVQFNDTSTCDPQTNLTGWNWSFDGGTSWTNLTDPAERNVTHTFGTAGTYPVILEVTDGNGGTSRATSPVSVFGPTFSVLAIAPSKGTIGATASVTITGTNFTSTPVMSVNLSRGSWDIGATNVKVTGNNKISCKFAIPLTAPGGTWNLTVRKSGDDCVVKPDAFTVNTLPAPKIASITPASGFRNGTMAFVLSGSNFIPGSIMTFSNSNHTITAVLDPITKTTKITGNLTTNASSLLGKWNISVVLPDGRTAVKTNAFQLKPYTTPVISSMIPTSGYPNMTCTFSVNGNLFQDPGTVVMLSRGIPGESIPLILTGISLKKMTGTVHIPPGAATAKWNLSVTTPDGGTILKNGVFTVKPWPAPRVGAFTPVTVTHDTTVPYTLTGTNFQPGSTVTLTNSSAPGLNFTAGVSTLSQMKITGTFDVPATASGKYGVEVTCPDGKVATKKNALNVK